ncbi:hypothetical protein ACFQ3R_03755 [Mesonia ostreae]|uniref:Uncharacterized protein n=1 Tax=Mesonia ostreae TaxID=861110 RepID=A0ABU2KJ48_9FLAO|nr:hypothetical protein [Mesonia ostreae]MDT0294736.1 hypothetical protein [Mesonia ostreae]
MKKTLEAELMSIAHRILQLKNKADVHELKAVTGVLYEKLSVLSFTEKHFDGPQPTIGKKNIEEALTEENKESQAEAISFPEEEEQQEVIQHEAEAIIEPKAEEIKKVTSSVPSETTKVEEVLEDILPQAEEETKDEFRSLGGVHYDDLPQFERPSEVNKSEEIKEDEVFVEGAFSEEVQPEEILQEKVFHKEIFNTEVQPEAKTEVEEEVKDEIEQAKDEGSLTDEQQNLFGIMPEFERKEDFNSRHAAKKKSLNDQLKKGIQIGLNDRLSYIKHLFDGDAADYNRVLSQLNSVESLPEAQRFIHEVVKPDYQNWENKEVYESRFLKAIENKYA